MDNTNLIIQMEARGDAFEVIQAGLQKLGATSAEAADQIKQANRLVQETVGAVGETFNLAKISAENLYKTVSNVESAQLEQMRVLLGRIQAEATVLRDAQAAFGKYSPPALEYSSATFNQSPDLSAKSFQDQVLGPGTSQSVATVNAGTRAYQQTLSELIAAEGGVTDRVLVLANAFQTSVPAIDKYREAHKLAADADYQYIESVKAELSAQNELTANARLEQELYSREIALQSTRSERIEQTTSAIIEQNQAMKALMLTSSQQGLLSPTSIGGPPSTGGVSIRQQSIAQVDEILGPGTYQGLQNYNELLTSQSAILEGLIAVYGVESNEVRDYVAATNASSASLRAYQQTLDGARRSLADFQATQHLGFQGNPVPGGVAPVAGSGVPVFAQQMALNRVDQTLGAGTSTSLVQYTEERAAMQANQQVLSLLVGRYGEGSVEVKQFASAMGLSTVEVKAATASASSAASEIGGLGKGFLAQMLQLSLIGGTFVIFGRILAAFTSGAVDQFHQLESAAQQVSTVQVGLDTSGAEASLQRLQVEVPATLQAIEASYYEVASVGSQTAQVSEELTKQISIGAAAAKADTKTWTDDVIGSMNAFHLWGQTADQTYTNTQRVQAEFFQAAKDSIGTPAQLAQSWGPVALAVQQAGGSMEDALALMVGASRGAGDFAQNMTTVYRMVNSLNTDKVQTDLRNFGVSLTDAGKVRPVLDILQQVHDKIKDLPQVQQTSIIESLFPELRANRGAQNLINNIDQIRAEVSSLGDSQAAYNQNVSTYMDTQAAKLALLDNKYNQFRQDLGKSIDPIRIVFNWIQQLNAASDPNTPPEQTQQMTPDQQLLGFDIQTLQEPALWNFFGQASGVGNLVSDKAAQDLAAEDSARKAADAQKALSEANSSTQTSFVDLYNQMSLGTKLETPFQKWTDQLNNFNTAVQGAQAKFEVSLTQQVAAGQAKTDLGRLPSDVSSAFSSALGTSDVQLNSGTKAAINQMALYAAQVQALQNLVNSPGTPEGQKDWAANQIQDIENLAGSYAKLHMAELDPQGEATRQKAIAQLDQEYARTEALAAMSDKLAAAQQHVADVQAHNNALLETARDTAQSLGQGLSSATALMSKLTSEGKDALSKGVSFSDFTQTTGPSEIEAWRAQQLALVSAHAQAGVNLVNASGLSSQEAGSQIGAIREGAATDAQGVNKAADDMRKALASMPAGLAESEASFQTTIDVYKRKVEDLKTYLLSAQTEVTRRQQAISATNASPTQETSGLRGQFAPSTEQLQSASPDFLSQGAGFLQTMLGVATPTLTQLDSLKRLIDTPVAGSGFMTQFTQQVADAKQSLTELQDAAQRVREMDAAHQLSYQNQTYALQTQENAQIRPLQDENFGLQNQQYAEQLALQTQLRPIQEANYQLERQMYQERVQENSVMRPINEQLWQYGQSLEHEQDIMTGITRKYDAELIPLQRQYNALQREQQEIQHATELQNLGQSLDNQTATLARLTPGTAQYLAVRQGLVKAESDYAIKSQEYSLSDKIASITAERDAAVQAEQSRINAITDAQRSEEERQQVLQHGFDLEKQGIQDTIDSNNEKETVLNHDHGQTLQNIADEISANEHKQSLISHGFDITRRGLDDENSSWSNFMANWSANETTLEQGATKRISLAELEEGWATKVSAAWVGVPTATATALQTQENDVQNTLNDWQTKYDAWKTEKLKPVQDAVEKIFTDSTGVVKQDYQSIIDKITGPNGLTDQLTVLGKAQDVEAQGAVKSIQSQTKELQNYYTLLDYVTRYQQSGGTAPFVLPPLPPGYVVPPGAPGSKENPNPSGVPVGGPISQMPPAPPAPPPPNRQPGVSPPPPPIGQYTAQTVTGGFQDGSYFRLGPLSGSGTPQYAAPVPVPAYAYSQGDRSYASTVNIQSGAITIVSQGPYRSQSDADRDGRMLVRAISSYVNMTGTSDGFGGNL